MLNLVTDRTLSDVENKTKKGLYNSDDLNRVQAAVDYLQDTLAGYGYSAEVVPLPTWSEKDEPTVPQLNSYLDNVRNVRDALQVLSPIPSVMTQLTYEGANQIEQALMDVEQVIERVVKSMVRSNAFTFWSGNRPLPSAESNLGRTWEELDAMNTTWRNWQVADWFLLLYGNLKAEGDVV